MDYSFEIEKIFEIIEKNLLTPAGKKRLRNFSPLNSIDQIKEEFKKLKEFERIKREGEFLFDFPDLQDFEKIYFKEKIFTPSELFLLLKFLEGIYKLKRSIEKSELLKEKFFKEYEKVFPLVEEMKKIFNHKGEIKDEATPELYRIRVLKKSLVNKIFNVLKQRIEELKTTDFLKDEEVRIKEGRFVILVDRSIAGRIGVVHGYSRTELSAYVEPFEAVDLQNEYKEVEEDERKEIERICIGLSKKIWEIIPHLKSLFEDLAEIDVINAKITFSEIINGTEPSYSKRKFFYLKNVYHPFLYLSKKGNVIPYNFELPENVNIFVISGPNGGGKTVFLKTIGLIVNMLKYAIPVPSSPDSHFYIPEKVYGIGFETEGSIEEGESNFTAHLKSFKKIIESDSNDILVLADEYMGNTDPDEGSALGFSIIKELLRKNVKGFFVTHLNGIKAFVEKEKDKRMRNASFGFDPIKKLPTYRINLGSFESSFAFEMAEKIGLPRGVVERAKTYSSGIGEIIKTLKEKAERMEREYREWMEKEKRRMEEEKKEFERMMLKKVEEMEREINELVREIRREKSIKKVKEVKKKIVYYKKNIKGELPEDIKIGEFYEIEGFSSPGEVIAVEKNKVLMKIGDLKIWTEKEKLSFPKEKPKKRKEKESFISMPSINTYSISVRGLSKEDALEQVERFIYESYARGADEVRILHGLGEGVLKRAIWDYLKKLKFVQDYYHPPYYEGGYGVTVVKFKNE